MKSIAGIIEGFLVQPGYAGPFVMGQSLPGNVGRIPIGIAGPKDLITEDYNPPTDAFNNVLRNKKNFKFTSESLEATLQRLAWFIYFSQIGGCDVVLISEGFIEYEGNSSGIPASGTDIFWRKNPENGIFIFDYNARTHLGLDWEFLLEDNKTSCQINLEAALNYHRSKLLMQNSALNIINKSIPLPQWDSSNQQITETKRIRIVRAGAYADVFEWDEVESRRLSLKSTVFKKPKDNRNISSYVDVSLEIQGSNASVAKVNELWNDNLFAEVRIDEELPNGQEIAWIIKGNTISNRTDLNAGKENRLASFKLEGQVSIRRVAITNNATVITIG